MENTMGLSEWNLPFMQGVLCRDNNQACFGGVNVTLLEGMRHVSFALGSGLCSKYAQQGHLAEWRSAQHIGVARKSPSFRECGEQVRLHLAI